jgi:hypothetical protein
MGRASHVRIPITSHRKPLERASRVRDILTLAGDMRLRNLLTRKNMRLKDYDYSRNGAYFVTVCIKGRHEILWDDGGARIARPQNGADLSDVGRIVDSAIRSIPRIYPHITLDKYAIMPNHIHMILLVDNGRAMRAPTPVSTVICQF